MLTALGTVFTQIITWFGSVITALTSTSGAFYALQDLFLVGIACSLVLLGIKVIRKIVWGN